MKFDPQIFARLWNDPRVSLFDMGVAMGVTHQTVCYHAKRMGLPPRGKMRQIKHDPALLAEMWLAGVNSADIAAHFGMTSSKSVGRAAKRRGLASRRRVNSGGNLCGWPATITIAQFWEARLAKRMAEAVKAERVAISKGKRMAAMGLGGWGAQAPRMGDAA